MRAHELHSAAGLRVLSVNGVDQEIKDKLKQSIEQVRVFVERLQLPFEVALDKRGEARVAYGILGLPSTMFIDSAGIVRHVHRGTITREEMDHGIAMVYPSR